jgi:rhodanese-related sulfurtransferase
VTQQPSNSAHVHKKAGASLPFFMANRLQSAIASFTPRNICHKLNVKIRLSTLSINFQIVIFIMSLRSFALAALLLLMPFYTYAITPFTNIDNQQLKTLQSQGIPVFDVRRADEWKETGIVKGSRKLTFVDQNGRLNPDFVSKFTQAVGKNDPVILICRTGSRTEALSNALVKDLGYTKVYNVKNGISRWLSEGLPVVRE